MRAMKRGALAVGVAGLMLSAGAAAFTPSEVRRPPNVVPCTAVETQYDLLETANNGANFAFWHAAEVTALAELRCPAIIEGSK